MHDQIMGAKMHQIKEGENISKEQEMMMNAALQELFNRDHANIIEEMSQVKAEMGQVKAENSQVKAEMGQVKAENRKLKEENIQKNVNSVRALMENLGCDMDKAAQLINLSEEDKQIVKKALASTSLP